MSSKGTHVRSRDGLTDSNASKARLSFLLNHDNEHDVTPGASSSAAASQWRRQMSETAHPPDPRSHEHEHDHSMSRARKMHSTVTPPASSQMSVEGAAAQNGAPDKRGVRKKRQRKFICETCGFGFYTNSDLQKHVSSVHLLLRPYECTMCDKKFGERSNATKHFKSVHERQKNAECEICHKVFAFRDGLVRHVRLVHDNVRNFHCRYPGCAQSFKQSAHLKKHEQVHNRARQGMRRGQATTSNATPS